MFYVNDGETLQNKQDGYSIHLLSHDNLHNYKRKEKISTG